MELRLHRRAFVNRAFCLDRKASIPNSCFASDFVDNRIQRASTPTFRWIRSSLILWGFVSATATCSQRDVVTVLCALWGDFTYWALTHSLHRLVPGRFLFSALPQPGFPLLMFRFGRQWLHGVDAYLRRRSAFTAKYALQVTWIRILSGRFARNFTCKHARDTLWYFTLQS